MSMVCVNHDPQQAEELGLCELCRGEIYEYDPLEADLYGGLYHKECLDKKQQEDARAELILSVLEAADRENAKYLSKDLCNAIWNALVRQFKLPEEKEVSSC